MRLPLNLASEPFVNRLPQVLVLSILLAGTLALTAWNVGILARSASEARAVEDQLAALDAEEEELRRRGRSLSQRLAGVDLKPLQLRATAANEVLAQKALRWSLLLERLEEILPWQAALKSIRTSVTKDGVVLTLNVRARGQDEVLDLLDALEASPCFSDAYPQSELVRPDGTFESSIEVGHDPYCGHAPEVPGMTARGAVTRRGGSRG